MGVFLLRFRGYVDFSDFPDWEHGCVEGVEEDGVVSCPYFHIFGSADAVSLDFREGVKFVAPEDDFLRGDGVEDDNHADRDPNIRWRLATSRRRE